MRYYSLRFALLPSVDFEKRMAALLDFCDKALIDDVMFFIAAEEMHVGHITKEDAKKYVDTISRAKRILKEKNITISLNPWCTLAHYDGGRKLKSGQNFRTMVGADGTKAEVAVCPLCENWREYYAELLEFYVETLSPDILWFEDDMRLSNHEPVRNGCFCEKHMELYNKLAGTDYDRETFVEKIFTDGKVRKAYLDAAEFSVRDTVEFLVKRLEKQKKFGLMTGGAAYAEGRKNSALFSVLGSHGEKPYDRICLYSYRQRGSQEYAWSFNEGSMLARFAAGDDVRCVSETENFPYGMYTKSAGYLRSQLLTGVQTGFVGDTFNIFDVCGNGATNYERYAKVLKETKPYLSRVTDLELKPGEMTGVRILVDEKSSYTLRGAEDFPQLQPYDSWLFAYLTQLGIACAYTYDKHIKGKVVGASGQVLRNLSDGEITELFANNFVMITGDNVAVLKERGLLGLIDATGFEVYAERTGKQSFEELNTGEEIFGAERFRATAQFFCGDYYNIRYGNKPKTIYTKLCDYNEQTVGAGLCAVGNALVFPYKNIKSDQNVPISLLCPLREHAIKSALSQNKVQTDELVFIQEENVCAYVYDKGENTVIVVVNFSDDDCETVNIKAFAEFENIEIFTPEDCSDRAASYSRTGGDYIINEVLKAHESYVLTCRKQNAKK